MALIQSLRAENRSINGSGNNLANPELGAAQTPFARIALSAYDDGIATPAVGVRNNARVISNLLCASDSDEPNAYSLSDYVWQWGQFLDHDITLSPTSDESFDIGVGPGDPMQGTIPFRRTVFDPATGTTTPRQQTNHVSSFIDASMVYGSNSVRAAALRSFTGGRLKTSSGELMPMNTGGLPNANDLHLPEEDLFLGGDVRSNEQLGLTCMHTIFLREHNHLADTIAAQNPMWDDESIYQRARKIVGAHVQAITYNEFLPAMLGPLAPKPSTFSYQPTRDPSISNEFATAIFRIGHTMVSDQLMLMQDDGQPAPVPSLGLFDAFFTPSTLINDPQKVDWILMGLSKQMQQRIDSIIVGSLRNQLFGPPGAGGLDLAALNIQRGRDHGLASYNDTRATYGLAPMASFDAITADPAMRSALAQAYADPDEIELWVGALMEDHLPGLPVGELMAVAMIQQFTDLAAGDRFFYLFDPELADVIPAINATSLSDIVMRNSCITSMPANIFRIPPAHLPHSQLSITVTGDDATITLNAAQTGATYHLQRSLDGQAWQTIASDLVPNAHRQVIATDPVAGDTRQRAFYRINRGLSP
ncbi:MAG: peroxidase [Verrucomicrobiales bacterium]